jgi:hypothetical protein
MKYLVFMIMAMAAAAITASAQTVTSNDVAGLKIMRVELQRTAAKGPSLRAVAGTDPASQAQAKADRASTSDNNPALHRMSQNAEIAPKTSSSDPLGNMPSSAPIVFVAAVLVKNIGERTVTAVQWEYLLFEAGATEPAKRYRVLTKRIILPNEQFELIKEVTPRGHEQQARLLRIEYSDGTFWQQK